MASVSTRESDLRSLEQMFAELDPKTVAEVLDAKDGDLSQATKALWGLAGRAGKPSAMKVRKGLVVCVARCYVPPAFNKR